MSLQTGHAATHHNEACWLTPLLLLPPLLVLLLAMLPYRAFVPSSPPPRAQAFRLQPDVVEQLQRLTDAFVGEAVKFGCELASHRRGAVLRPTDLATYLERTHHLHVPGFTKEYHPYRRPAASELHRERTAAVRKAQLAASAGAGGGGGDGPGGGGRGTGAGTGGE